ncbi:hypothetical protein PMN64_23625 [Bradyrhizobium sp. UFLA01-814]|uniref:hypothetical protein n=1 Tax=Bradyrhizobium sp. UFLA01-814 TaxID=3023480 RepID=UPI00398B38F0
MTTGFDCERDRGPSVAQQMPFGVMGPGFRQDGIDCVARPTSTFVVPAKVRCGSWERTSSFQHRAMVRGMSGLVAGQAAARRDNKLRPLAACAIKLAPVLVSTRFLHANR